MCFLTLLTYLCSNLAHNKLTGPLPDLTGMDSLNYVYVITFELNEFLNKVTLNVFIRVICMLPTRRDLSNNSFDSSEAPAWFSTLSSLTTL